MNARSSSSNRNTGREVTTRIRWTGQTHTQRAASNSLSPLAHPHVDPRMARCRRCAGSSRIWMRRSTSYAARSVENGDRDVTLHFALTARLVFVCCCSSIRTLLLPVASFLPLRSASLRMMDDDPVCQPFVPSVDLDALGSRTARSRLGFTPRSPTLFPPFESPSPRSPLASTGAHCVASVSAAANPYKYLPDFFPSNPHSPVDATESGGCAGDMVDQMLSHEDPLALRRGGAAGPGGWAAASAAVAPASPFVPTPHFASTPNRTGGGAPRSRFAAVGASSFGDSLTLPLTPGCTTTSNGASNNARRDRRTLFDSDDLSLPASSSSHALGGFGDHSTSTASPAAPQMVSRRLSGTGLSARSSVAASPASSYSTAPSSTSSRHSSLRFGSPLSAAHEIASPSPATAMRSLTIRER